MKKNQTPIDPTLLDWPSDQARLQEFSKAMRSYKERLREDGLFDPETSKAWPTALASLLLLAASLASLAAGGWWVGAASVLLALHYCQSAYVSHDAAHGQIIREKKALRWIFAGLTLSHGMSLMWWQRKHSVHHGNPNALRKTASGMGAVDEDIDTLPFICWDPRLMRDKKVSKALDAWVRAQHIAAWPLFAILRLTWIVSGLRKGTSVERWLICAHHGALMAAAMAMSGAPGVVALAWLVGANLISGFFLACFFLFGHTGMDIYDQAERGDHWQSQMRSTRNFSPNPVATWLAGGLNFQIEHHLFPLLPRRHLPMAAKHVRKVAAMHGVAYEEIGMLEGLFKIGSALCKARPPRGA